MYDMYDMCAILSKPMKKGRYDMKHVINHMTDHVTTYKHLYQYKNYY